MIAQGALLPFSERAVGFSAVPTVNFSGWTKIRPAVDLQKLILGELRELVVQGFDFLFQGVQFFFRFHGVCSFSMILVC